MTILEFMLESPIFSFFLLGILIACIEPVIKHITNSGRCPDCKRRHEKED